MAIYNRYILSVAILILVSAVILTAISPVSLGQYYTVFIIEALVVTELYVYLNPKVRLALTPVTIVLALAFGLALLLEISKIRIIR